MSITSAELGPFITLEGGDGSGKATQAEILENTLRERFGKNVLKLSFPRYGMPSAYYAGKFLDGEYGTIDQVHPDLASLPYALDRFAARDELFAHLALPDAVGVSDRYLGSNLAHNGAKFRDLDERLAYYERQMNTELNILGIPRPNLNIVLLVDTDVAQQNVDKKAARTYTDKKRDIHEADAGHLDLAKAAYKELCEIYPDFFTSIDAMNGNSMKSIEAISKEILTKVEPLL